MSKSGPEPGCNCKGCESRRRIQRQYYEKNREKVLARNNKTKIALRKRLKEIGTSPEVSDEELDRRAQEMEGK